MDINDHQLILEEYAAEEKNLQQRQNQIDLSYEETKNKLAYTQASYELRGDYNNYVFHKTRTLHEWWRQGSPDGIRADAEKLDFRGVDVRKTDFHDWKNLGHINLAGAKNIKKAYGLMMQEVFRNIRDNIKTEDRKHQPDRRNTYLNNLS